MAGTAGLEPTTCGFGDRCSAKLSYAPALAGKYTDPTGLPAQALLFVLSMMATLGAELAQRQIIRHVLPILGGYIVTHLALAALQYYLSLGHMSKPYSITLVTTPAPTVWPPSRMANRTPASIAMG